MEPNSNNMNDHDLLIRVDTKVDFIRSELGEFKTGINRELGRLEVAKLDKREAERLLQESGKINDDHEKRIRRNEKVIFFGLGGLAVIQMIVTYVLR